MDGVQGFQRIARCTCERLVHVRDQRRRVEPRAVCDAHQARRKCDGSLMIGHECAAADLHVENQALQAGGKFLGQDRGGDQRHRFNRRRHVANGVEAPVRGGEALGLADNGAADLVDDAAQQRRIGLAAVARDCDPACRACRRYGPGPAGNHRHDPAAGGDDRREHQ
jgi:hypothetical protein